jgi:hypothetical protein
MLFFHIKVIKQSVLRILLHNFAYVTKIRPGNVYQRALFYEFGKLFETYS